MRRPLGGSPRISCDHACHLKRGSAGGTDYAVPAGTPVFAPFDGRATHDTGGSGGWRVRVRNLETGHDFWGLHLSGWEVADGQQVKEGQLIARSGGAIGHPGAGSSTGPHFHAHVHDQQQRWGMEEYLKAHSGGGSTEPPKGDDMRLIKFKKNGKTTWARFTGFAILETTSQSEASRWDDMAETSGPRTANASLILAWWAKEAALNTAAIAAAVGQQAVDVEALSESIVARLDLGAIADAVDDALADDFAAVPGGVADEIDARTRERLS